MMMPPPRSRPRRPMMAALRNACMRNPVVPSGLAPGIPQIQLQPGALQPMQVNFPMQAAAPQSPAGVRQMQPQFQTPQAQSEQWWNIAANTQLGTVGQAWVPATSGPMPPGASVWVVWNGGGSGTRHYAGSSWTQPVTVLQSMPGGPSGVMVLVQPSIVPDQFYAMR